MRASVIVITRNHSSYLADGLAALSKQDHPDFEIVIVDSSSDEEKEKKRATGSSSQIYNPVG